MGSDKSNVISTRRRLCSVMVEGLREDVLPEGWVAAQDARTLSMSSCCLFKIQFSSGLGNFPQLKV